MPFNSSSCNPTTSGERDSALFPKSKNNSRLINNHMTSQQSPYSGTTTSGFGISKSLNSKSNNHNVSRGVGMGYQTSVEEQCNHSSYFAKLPTNKS